jgi:hypothetical protein
MHSSEGQHELQGMRLEDVVLAFRSAEFSYRKARQQFTFVDKSVRTVG